MQQHLKERLTGATILVLVVGLLVPEMFRGRPAGGIDTHVGAADGAPMRSYTIDLRDSPTARPPAVAPPAVSPPAAAVGEGAPIVSSATLPEVGAMKAPSASSPAPNAPAASSAPAPTRSRAAAPKSGWTVQVATFARRDFAERMVKQIRAKGFAVQAVGPDDRGLYRVRSAPTSERAAALALKEKMRARGLKPLVISLP
ncbi:MAG: SPOR domain-containing protein [Steroidobacteraceae bacterium]